MSKLKSQEYEKLFNVNISIKLDFKRSLSQAQRKVRFVNMNMMKSQNPAANLGDSERVEEHAELFHKKQATNQTTNLREQKSQERMLLS